MAEPKGMVHCDVPQIGKVPLATAFRQTCVGKQGADSYI
jgi:hypothetical protein